MLLAIDTSTETASLALWQQGVVVAELTWHSAQNQTRELLPNLAHLLKLAGVELRRLTALVVARGPGSYNGLRAGMASAKGLALALELPLVGIGTLEAEALPYAETGLTIRPIQDAGRGEVATALYRELRHRWRQLEEEHLTTLEALYSEVRLQTLFCGALAYKIADQLGYHLGKLAVVPASPPLRRAGYLAELGRRRLEANDHDDLATLQPLYLRRPAITQPRPRLAQVIREGQCSGI